MNEPVSWPIVYDSDAYYIVAFGSMGFEVCNKLRAVSGFLTREMGERLGNGMFHAEKKNRAPSAPLDHEFLDDYILHHVEGLLLYPVVIH